MTDGTTLIVVAILAGFCAAAAGGFAVGYRYAAAAPKRLLERASRDTERSLSEAAAAVDLAGRLCEAVATAAVVTERQIAALFERQRVLMEALARLKAAVRVPIPAEQSRVEWSREPLDRETELPDRVAFDENVKRLLAVSGAGPRGGVLLVAVDSIDRLRKRAGDAGVAGIRRSVARLLCRSVREADLACRLDESTFAILLSDPETDAAVAQAAVVREAFRTHPFRTGPDGPELLVTASFGFTPVLPGDVPKLLLDRAGACVARSRRWGRNRLHAYEPQGGRYSLVAGQAAGAQHVAGIPA